MAIFSFISKMTSVERIVEYTSLDSEGKDSTKKAPPKWPEHGEIDYSNVSFAYEKTLPSVLKNITLKIHPGEKVGIVGRTGAGKSSFFQSLYRMAEPTGLIRIDGVNIKEITLHDLRSNLAIIPVRLFIIKVEIFI
jgi:ABC-type multidrug transport system fused ATPase/permease subunit